MSVNCHYQLRKAASVVMPSGTASPLLHFSMTATFSSHLNSFNYMKPYKGAYISDYLNKPDTTAKPEPQTDDESVSQSSPTTTQDSISFTKKRVSFADSVGLELVQIRHMTAGRDTPPNLDPALIASLNTSEHCVEVPLFQLGFQQPVSNYNHFRQSLERNQVCLENATINANRIVGTVKVKNLSYQKTVFLRFTYDNWASHENINAYYVNNGLGVVDGTDRTSSVDTFSFSFELPIDRVRNFGIQFAVCFRCDGQEFWDNNGGQNYRITINKSGSGLSSSGHSHVDIFQKRNSWTEFAIWRTLESDYTPYW